MNPAPPPAVAPIEPCIVVVPPDLVDALAADGEAGWRFADLSSSAQRSLVRAIQGARTGETRRRRIARTVKTLRAGGI